MPSQIEKQVEAEKHHEPDERLGDEKGGRRRDADPPRGQRAVARALDARVELAVEDVVVGGAGAAHRDRADEKQREMAEVGSAMEREAGERRRLPAGREQQLPAGRPVEPGELDEGKREIGREPQDEARRPGVRQERALRRRASKRSGAAAAGPAGRRRLRPAPPAPSSS